MKHRKYTCHICKRQVTKANSFLVESPCNRNTYPNGIGKSRVCKTHPGVEQAALPETTAEEEAPATA